jgi:hypothetical protein
LHCFDEHEAEQSPLEQHSHDYCQNYLFFVHEGLEMAHAGHRKRLSMQEEQGEHHEADAYFDDDVVSV